jgi:hypothetical protein
MTPSQLEAARAWLRENWSVAPRDLTEEGADRTAQMIHTLLSATETPSGDAFLLEAAHAANSHCEYVDLDPAADVVEAKRALSGENEGDAWYDAVRLYIAGARREGRK